jgi:hypothetical protein
MEPTMKAAAVEAAAMNTPTAAHLCVAKTWQAHAYG